MAGGTLWGPYAVRYQVNSMGAAALMGGISRIRATTNPTPFHDVAAGSGYPFTGGIREMKPTAEFATRDISAGIANITIPVATLTGAGVELFQMKKVDGVKASGSVHRKIAMLAGAIVPRRLTVPQEGDAELSYEVLAAFDGTNDPFKVTENVALPSETLADGGRYGMRSAEIGGVTVGGKLSLEIDFGVSGNLVNADGNVYAEYVDVDAYLARITIRGIKTDVFAAAGIPLEGLAAAHADTAIYLGKRSGAGYAAGSDHIKITAGGTAYVMDAFDANGNRRGECAFGMVVVYDGTNAPIIFADGEALP